nr:hypothetical protein Iba_chr10cCG9540 [Ipomoea batatas]
MLAEMISRFLSVSAENEKKEAFLQNPPKRAKRSYARALTPCPSINLLACWHESTQWTQNGPHPRLTTTAQLMTQNPSLTDGGLTKSNLHPTSRSRDLTVRLWLLVNIRIALPSFPARPVRPERCTKVSGSLGIELLKAKEVKLREGVATHRNHYYMRTKPPGSKSKAKGSVAATTPTKKKTKAPATKETPTVAPAKPKQAKTPPA